MGGQELPAARERTEEPRVSDLSASLRAGAISHNLNGQKLGRKGRDTRERILSAAAEIIANEPETQISLSAVARKASLGMTSLYNYFTDLTELLLAVLEPVMATAEDAYIGRMRDYWPDEELSEYCAEFTRALYGFWQQHNRLLHLRNNMADAHDLRMMQQRILSTQPVINLIVVQMDGDPAIIQTPAVAMASVLMTGIERSITVNTDDYVRTVFGEPPHRSEEHHLWPVARLMELAIRDVRSQMREFNKGVRSR